MPGIIAQNICGNIGYMRNVLIERILSLVFPRKFDISKINTLAHAPQPPISFIYACFDYQSQGVKKLIRYLKTYRDPFLVQTLAEKIFENSLDFIAEQQQFSFFHNPIIIPVPVSRKRKRERGFNQTELLAHYLSKKLPNASYNKKLAVKNDTDKQALITGKHKRIENIRGAFLIPERQRKYIRDRDIIIVDDLVTTGATLRELKKTLEKAGARKIIALTIAH